MSDEAPPGVVEGIVRPASQGLSAEQIETVLGDFRSWLQGFSSASVASATPPAETPDLFTLLAQFTALRHEVNLQTRAVRSQQEQNNETLQQLARAVDTLQEREADIREAEESSSEEELRPLLKTLVDLHDALSLAQRQVQRVQESIVPELARLHEPPQLPGDSAASRALTAPPNFWGWAFGDRGKHIREALSEHHQHQALARQRWQEWHQNASAITERILDLVESILTGYTMSVQRIERALQQYGLQAIPAVGEPFDPEVMEVLDVVTEPGRTTTEVIEEVRRGYFWHNRLFRYAQVRVAKPAPSESNP
jgi:molecular chaperone GrpE